MSETRSKRNEKIVTLIDRANAAIGDGDWYDAERFAGEAMELAYKGIDFLRMSVAIEALREARTGRREAAVGCGAMYAFDSPIGEDDFELAEGCWLIEPPRVGADGRDLREMASQKKIAMFPVCREPVTATGLWPIVAVGPVVIRAKIRPPQEVTPSWFVTAIEALGASAIDDVDPESGAIDRVEELFLRLQTIPDAMCLHDALLDACREAAAADARAVKGGAKPDQAAA